MSTGIIFDIKEFSVNDGPGVRQTVFFKGCPISCDWCHNPEGLECYPQLMVRRTECVHCGKCEDICTKETCEACGDCVRVCPQRLRSICGREMTSDELANEINRNASEYADMDGGVTFSGGEPLMQSSFLLDTIAGLTEMHVAVETSGYAEKNTFESMMASVNLVMMDLKLIDPKLHKQYCGESNEPILGSLSLLKEGQTPFIVRVPLIPGVTDTEDNLHGIATMLKGAQLLQYVELLPYNRLAGAKYGSLGRDYQPHFDVEQPIGKVDGIFKEYGIESRVL